MAERCTESGPTKRKVVARRASEGLGKKICQLLFLIPLAGRGQLHPDSKSSALLSDLTKYFPVVDAMGGVEVMYVWDEASVDRIRKQAEPQLISS